MKLINTVLLNTLYTQQAGAVHRGPKLHPPQTALFVGYLTYVTGIKLGARNEVMIIIKTMYIFSAYFNIIIS